MTTLCVEAGISNIHDITHLTGGLQPSTKHLSAVIQRKPIKCMHWNMRKALYCNYCEDRAVFGNLKCPGGYGMWTEFVSCRNMAWRIASTVKRVQPEHMALNANGAYFTRPLMSSSGSSHPRMLKHLMGQRWSTMLEDSYNN